VTLGQHARAARIAARLSQGMAARESGVKRSQISDMERDKHSPNIRTLIRLADVYALPVSVLIGEMPIPNQILINRTRVK